MLALKGPRGAGITTLMLQRIKFGLDLPSTKALYITADHYWFYGEVDLSRRVLTYNLPGMSFREYLKLMGALDYDSVPMGDIISKHELPETGDFLANDLRIDFGGKNKTGKQLDGVGKSIIASDGIEIGYGNKVPLWMLGFLY